jgi:hypothetical protein
MFTTLVEGPMISLMDPLASVLKFPHTIASKMFPEAVAEVVDTFPATPVIIPNP